MATTTTRCSIAGSSPAHDAKTGKEIYTKVRLDPTAGGFTASPWAYNGKLFAMSEDGMTYVIQAGPEFKVLGQNVLDEFTMASPAIHRDSLIVRTASALYRIAASKTHFPFKGASRGMSFAAFAVDIVRRNA